MVTNRREFAATIRRLAGPGNIGKIFGRGASRWPLVTAGGGPVVTRKTTYLFETQTGKMEHGLRTARHH
jgi:hypothetical protein